MVSASHGHHVDVFEPNKVNIVRECQSMWMNQWGNAEEDEILARTSKRGSINIRPYGVGANTTTMTFYVGRNPGKATMVRSMLPTAKWIQVVGSEINIVTLDSMAHDLGWFEKKGPIVIMKVDVEGFEPSVFGGGKKLLQSGLIENILMEVTGQDDNSENENMLKLIIDAGYYLHQVGGIGPVGKVNMPVSDNVPKALLAKHTRKTRMQANFWWIYNTTQSTTTSE